MSGNSDQDKGWAGKAIASFRDGAKAVMDVLREAAESTGTLITWSADPTTLKPSDSLKACILLFVLWVGFFAVGATTETQNIVCRLNEYNFVFLLPVLAVTYTYSNIAFLAFLSGLLGGVLSNLSLSSYMRTTGSSVAKLLQEEDPRSISYRLEPPIASGIRSFAIYLLYIAGISIVVRRRRQFSDRADRGRSSIYPDRRHHFGRGVCRWFRPDYLQRAPLPPEPRPARSTHKDAAGCFPSSARGGSFSRSAACAGSCPRPAGHAGFCSRRPVFVDRAGIAFGLRRRCAHLASFERGRIAVASGPCFLGWTATATRLFNC